jgi:protein-S-isoprenylcysteine O-methyltransferase Ste14
MFSQEFIGRWFGLAIFAGMTVRNAMTMPPLDGPVIALLRWALLTGLFALFTAAYLRRPKASALASRPVEILLPLLVVALPTFQAGGPQVAYRLVQESPELMSAMQYLFRPVGGGIGNIASLTGMAIGEAFAIYAMVYLGRSFSIFAEARNLVTGGPYRLVRHPLYAGEMVAIWSYTLAYPSRWSLGVISLFTALQCWRARVEERKLEESFPEYAVLRARTGFMWPKLQR